MPDAQKPVILTMLSVLAIIIGVFSFIRGVLMLYGGISQVAAGLGGFFELIIGVISISVGVLAVFSAIRVLWEWTGCIELMKKYAVALIAYEAIWFIYAIVSGGRVGWGSALLDLGIGVGTLALIMMNEDIRTYGESLGK